MSGSQLLNRSLHTRSQYGDKPWYIPVCALGAVFNIVMMIVANTIGFVLGPKNSLVFLKEVFGTWSGELVQEPFWTNLVMGDSSVLAPLFHLLH